jgi:type IV secretion system protein VirB9
VCDIALQPGEVVNSIHVGDKVRWSVMPAVSGLGSDRTTHLIVKPADAGLVSSILVFTDRRTYSMKLVSTQRQWTPMTAFTYLESAQAAWAGYDAMLSSTNANVTSGDRASADHIDFNYRISGSARWKPVRVYAVGGKTYVEFPHSVQFGSAPALIGLANDGSWFSSPSQRMERYRVAGDKYIVDGVLDHAMLVTGVGGDQAKVDLRREQ